MTMVKVFGKKVKLQSQGHYVKNYGMMWEVLSQGIHMWYIMKVLSLVVHKLWPRLKFLSTDDDADAADAKAMTKLLRISVTAN